jgi:hypothetical protein
MDRERTNSQSDLQDDDDSPLSGVTIDASPTTKVSARADSTDMTDDVKGEEARLDRVPSGLSLFSLLRRCP